LGDDNQPSCIYVYIEGSVHKGSKSIYFRFSFFTPSDRCRRARQACDVSLFLISQHSESYKPSKMELSAPRPIFCVHKLRFYRSPDFDRTFVHTLITPCIADRSGTEVLCDYFIANPILQRAQSYSCSAERFYLALLKVTRFYQ